MIARAAEPAVSTAPVTFDQILERPDDIELNLRFARQQIDEGNLRGAAATLERVMADAPGRQDVELLHAALSLKLGNIEDSRRELNSLSAASLSPEIKERLAAFKREAERRGRVGELGLVAGMGFQYDTNRNAAPASGQALLFDTPLQLSPGSRRRDDTAITALAGLDASHDIGDAGERLFGAASYYREEQTLLKTLNLQAYSLSGGVAFKLGDVEVRPSLLFDHLLLAQTTYLRDRGASLRLARRLPSGLGLFVEGRDVYQAYSPTDVAPLAQQRDGVQDDLVAGFDYLLTPRLKAGLSYGHGLKHASFSPDSFDRDGVDANLFWLPRPDIFLSSDLVVNWDRYPVEDDFISARGRRDNTWRATGTLGMPLGRLWPPLDDVVLTVTYEYFQEVSNILNFSYTNNKIGTMLTYRWGLGLL